MVSSTQSRRDQAKRAPLLIAMTASAGGLGAVKTLLSHLPPDLPAAIVLVQHLNPEHRSYLASILGRGCDWHVSEARQGDELLAGSVYVAPPNFHLLVNPDSTLTLTQTPPVHFVRPSADLLFASAAKSYKEHLIAVVLTGMGTDGALGLKAVKEHHGTVLVQAGAEFSGMPNAAIESGHVDQTLSLDDLPGALTKLARLDQLPS